MRATPDPKRIRAPFRLPGSALCYLLLLPGIYGQTLSLPPASAPPGGRVAIEISFKSKAGNEVSTLQWETTIPAARLNFADEGVVSGAAANAAGKSVNCAPKASANSASKTLACILFGGQQAIPDGVIALLRLQVLPEAVPGTAQIRIDQALAVSKDLKRFPIDAVDGTVTVTGK